MIAIVGLPVLAIGPGAAPETAPAGLAALIAMAAASAGGSVQLIGKVGDDPDGDAALLALGLAGVGHVATLRDPGHPTPVERRSGAVLVPDGDDLADEDSATALLGLDPDGGPPGPGDVALVEPLDPGDRPGLDSADVELALRYLPDVRVLIVVDPAPGVVAVAAAEAFAGGAHLAVVHASGPADPGTTSGSDGEPEVVPPDALVLAAPADGEAAMFATLVGRYAATVDAGSDPRRAFETVLAGLAGERATT